MRATGARLRSLGWVRTWALPLLCALGPIACGDDDDTHGTLDGGLSDASVLDAALGSDASGDAAPAPAGPEVITQAGALRGKLVDETRVFLGIPYARPPVGTLRFMPPEPADPWSGTRAAVEFGPSCPQPELGLSAAGPQSEDCLSLNVYAPESGTGPLPVMVWVHGGALVAGGSVQYDAARLAREHGVVIVTLNYRLGALGLLAHPRLDAQRGAVPSGNDAFRDQQLALRWVQDNIAAFEGDPANVTLFGESAGSMSSCLHLVSPLSQGLAHKYIMQSGVCIAGLEVGTTESAQAVGGELADAFCPGAADPIACLREQDAAELVAWGSDRGISGAGWAPVANPADPLLPEPPLDLVASGRVNQGPALLGTNKAEWALFLYLRSSSITTVAALEAAVDGQFPEPLRPAIKAHYTATDATASNTFVRLMTDAFFRCPTRALARLLATQGTPVYLYSFEQGLAFHAYEIQYVFGTPSAQFFVTDVAPLHGIMAAYWTQFAKTGDPNVAGQLAWPAYTVESDQHMTLKNEPVVGSMLAKADCDFWEALVAAQ